MGIQSKAFNLLCWGGGIVLRKKEEEVSLGDVVG
jgi:hypothetical protein